MYGLLIIVGIGGLVHWYQCCKYDRPGGLAIAFGVLSVLLWLMFSLGCSEGASLNYTEVNSSKICAMKDGGSVSGAFFLGCGSIGSDPNYYYLVEDYSVGGYKMESLSTSMATVEESSAQPKLVTYKGSYKNKIMHSLLFCDNLRYKFVVPPGSIKYEYKVDME